jgi:hypothetical protein
MTTRRNIISHLLAVRSCISTSTIQLATQSGVGSDPGVGATGGWLLVRDCFSVVKFLAS